MELTPELTHRRRTWRASRVQRRRTREPAPRTTAGAGAVRAGPARGASASPAKSRTTRVCARRRRVTSRRWKNFRARARLTRPPPPTRTEAAPCTGPRAADTWQPAIGSLTWRTSRSTGAGARTAARRCTGRRGTATSTLSNGSWKKAARIPTVRRTTATARSASPSGRVTCPSPGTSARSTPWTRARRTGGVATRSCGRASSTTRRGAAGEASGR